MPVGSPGFQEQGCVWHSPGPLLVLGWHWQPPQQVPDSVCSCPVCRVFLALVAEAEDRGGVVAQGGGKVRWWVPRCPQPVPWGGLGL